MPVLPFPCARVGAEGFIGSVECLFVHNGIFKRLGGVVVYEVLEGVGAVLKTLDSLTCPV